MKRTTEIILTGTLLIFSPCVFAESAEDVVQELQASYEAIHTISARFHQTYRSKRFEPRDGEGLLWLQKPGKMRWDYTVPKGRVLVSDGKNLMLYDPADEQVLVSRISKEEGLPIPLSFLWGKEKIADVFSVTLAQHAESKGEIRLRCVPRKPIPNVVEVELTLRRQKPVLIVASRVIDALEGENQLTFSDLKTNPPVSEKRFEFKPPPGARKVPIDSQGSGS